MDIFGRFKVGAVREPVTPPILFTSKALRQLISFHSPLGRRQSGSVQKRCVLGAGR